MLGPRSQSRRAHPRRPPPTSTGARPPRPARPPPALPDQPPSSDCSRPRAMPRCSGWSSPQPGPPPRRTVRHERQLQAAGHAESHSADEVGPRQGDRRRRRPRRPEHAADGAGRGPEEGRLRRQRRGASGSARWSSGRRRSRSSTSASPTGAPPAEGSGRRVRPHRVPARLTCRPTRWTGRIEGDQRCSTCAWGRPWTSVAGRDG